MIDHIAFVVSDPEKTAATLAKFGYHIYRRTPHHGGSVEVECDEQKGLILELCTKRPQDTVGFNHACVRIADEDALKELVAGGLTLANEPHLSVETGRYITNYLDADGVKWQIAY